MHEIFMRRCLELAERARGKTGVNPMVGAVLVRDGKIVAEGFHREFGKAHAERDLLEPAKQSARSARFGALREIRSTDTLYVNLEPCCHTNKKTLPCIDLLIQSGIKRIVIGMRDPNPEVSGKGIEALQKADIEVTVPVLEDECLRLNRGFTSLMRHGRPWITLKSATMRDGRIANPDGSFLKITSEDQDRWSHEYLRARHDAILVGVGAILSDDSRLTVRIPTLTPTLGNARVTPLPSGEGTGERVPYRIVLDPELRIPLDSTLLNDEHRSRTMIVCRASADGKKQKDLERHNVRVLICTMRQGVFDWAELFSLLTKPTDSFFGITSILVEGGARTWKGFRNAGMVDREVILTGA